MQGAKMFDIKKYFKIIMLEIRILWISLHLLIIFLKKFELYMGIIVNLVAHSISKSVNFTPTYSQILLA